MGNREETQTKLIEAAIKLFTAKGYKGTTIRDIARATGMTVSNTYYHFGSKHGLLVAIINKLSTELQEELKRICESDFEPLVRFKEFVRTHLDRAVSVDKMNPALLLHEEEGLSPATNDALKKVQLDFLNIYRQELRNLQAAGYLRRQNVTILSFYIISVVEWHIRWYKPDGRLSLDEIKDEVLDFILNGILDCHKKKRGSVN